MAVWHFISTDSGTTTIMPPVQIAHIEERVVFSRGGKWAVVFLVLNAILPGIPVFIETVPRTPRVANTIDLINSIDDGEWERFWLIWIGWIIVWGLAAIIGRRRTYIVYRDIVTPDQQETPERSR